MLHRSHARPAMGLAFAALMISLTACGGGGGGGGTVTPPTTNPGGSPTPTPTHSPSPSPSHSPSPSPSHSPSPSPSNSPTPKPSHSPSPSPSPSQSPSPSPSPTAPANNAITGDYGEANGLLTYVNIGTKTVAPVPVSGGFQLDSVAYVPGSLTGMAGNGASQNLIPFTVSGNTISPGTPIDISGQCVPQTPPVNCDGSAVVMPDQNTAIVALNAFGSHYLLEANLTTSPPTFSTIPMTMGTPEDTSGLAMSPDGQVLVSRGAHLNVFKETGTDAYSETAQVTVLDPADSSNGLRGREGVDVFKASSGDYQALVANTSTSPQNGTLWLFAGLGTSSPMGVASTRIDPSLHGYSVATDGYTAFVGTDVGIAIVGGVNKETFPSDIRSVATPASCVLGQTLMQVSSVAVIPGKQAWLVAMGLSGPASGPGGATGCIDVMPIIYTGGIPSLGAPVESETVTAPPNDQLIVF